MRYIFALFDSLSINQQMNSRRVWSEEEDKAIQDLVEQYGTKNWAIIATHLAKRLGQKPRSGKQCRERWHNHLDPGIEKKGWNSGEEEKMFQLHKLHGNKWTVIAEQLPGRTDNAIKNYFYSTIRRSLRRMGKFVGSKNSTEQMKKIKPSTLSKIFAAGSELIVTQDLKAEQAKLITYIKQNCESVREEIVQFTNYKPKRNDKAPDSERNRYEKVIEKMIHINEVYERIKGEEKMRRYEEEMFQRDYNKLMKSEQSENLSEDEELSDSAKLVPTVRSTSTRIRKKINTSKIQFASQSKECSEQNEQEADNINLKGDTNSNINHMMPTVIIKSQQNLDNQQEDAPFQNPDFLIQLKEDFHTAQPNNHFNPTLRSPGYYFNTPSTNPFSFFQSPSTPKSIEACFSTFQGFGVLQNSAIDEFQISIQREIQCNLSGEDRKMASSISTIGSPGSAFRFFGGIQ